MTAGILAFNNRPHNLDLCLDICRGLRPEIIEKTMFEYKKLMKECLDSDPNNRPTAKQLVEYFKEWNIKYPIVYEETERVPVTGK